MLYSKEINLFKSDLSREINLFTGAGFSTLATNASGSQLPIGETLKKSLIKEFRLENYSALDLPGLYTIILSDRKIQLREYLKSLFTVNSYDNRYDFLRLLRAPYLYTTNIDDLPFLIFNARPNDDKPIIHDIAIHGAPRNPRETLQFIALHGNVRHEDNDFLFTNGQISSAFASDRETWYNFQRELQARPTIFLGYGMHDAGVLQALHDSTKGLQYNRWVLVRRNDESTITLYENLNFHVIIGEVSDFLEFIRDNTPIFNDSQAYRDRKPLTGRIPRAAEVAQRPVRNFF